MFPFLSEADHRILPQAVQADFDQPPLVISGYCCRSETPASKPLIYPACAWDEAYFTRRNVASVVPPALDSLCICSSSAETLITIRLSTLPS
jgi:hypothetical protein